MYKYKYRYILINLYNYKHKFIFIKKNWTTPPQLAGLSNVKHSFKKIFLVSQNYKYKNNSSLDYAPPDPCLIMDELTLLKQFIFLGSQYNFLSVFDKIVEMHFPLLVVCLICERQCCGCGYAVRACPVLITRNAFLPAQPLILSPQNCPLLFHCPEGSLQLLVSHS